MTRKGLYGNLVFGAIYLTFAYCVTKRYGQAIYPKLTFDNWESLVFVVGATLINLGSFFGTQILLRKVEELRGRYVNEIRPRSE